MVSLSEWDDGERVYLSGYGGYLCCGAGRSVRQGRVYRESGDWKNTGKLPISFKNYFESIFKTRDRFYLSDSYERYLSSMYDEGDDTGLPITKSGKISVIILSVIIVVIAVIGYVVFKFGR